MSVLSMNHIRIHQCHCMCFIFTNHTQCNCMCVPLDKPYKDPPVSLDVCSFHEPHMDPLVSLHVCSFHEPHPVSLHVSSFHEPHMDAPVSLHVCSFMNHTECHCMCVSLDK